MIWTQIICLPGGSDGKESTHNAGDPGLIPELGRLDLTEQLSPSLLSVSMFFTLNIILYCPPHNDEANFYLSFKY